MKTITICGKSSAVEYLARYFLIRGHHVAVIDNLNAGSLIFNTNKQKIQHSDVVINMFDTTKEMQYFETYISNTDLLLKNMFPDQKYIHVSDYKVYGSYDLVAHTELSFLDSSSVYSAVRVASDTLVKGFLAEQRINAVIVRSAEVVGQQLTLDNFYGEQVYRAMNKLNLRSTNTFNELLDIEDFCSAIDLLMQSKYEGVINIGSGKRISEKEILLLIKNEVATGAQLIQTDTTILKYGIISDIANNILGWKATNCPMESLRKSVRNAVKL